MKKLFKYIAAFLTALIVFVLPLRAAPAYITDEYGLLTDAERNKLDQLAQQISEKYNVGTYVRVVNGTEGMGIEDYAEYRYKSEGMGLGAQSDGILLIIDMDGRYYDICAYGDTANRQFTDKRKDNMANAFLGDLSSGYYYNAFKTYLNDCDYYLGTEVIPYQPAPPKMSDFAPLFAFPPIVSLITVLVRKRRNKTRGIRTTATEYIPQGGVSLDRMYDMYLYREVHRVPIPQRAESRGGGFDSGHTTVNSGGFSHHSGKF